MNIDNNYYDIIISKKDNLYLAQIKEIGILVESNSELNALNECILQKNKYLELCYKNNINLPEPISNVYLQNKFNNFFIKKIFNYSINLTANFIFTILILLSLFLFLINPAERKIRQILNDPSTIVLINKVLDKLQINVSKK